MYEVASRAVRTDAGDVERVTELGAVAGMTRQRPQLQRPVRELALQALQHTHIHPFNGPFSGTTQVSRYQKVILLKQETVSGRGISWAVSKSAPRSRQITMPAPHHSVFLQAGCPSCRPTNSVKALKA